MTHADTTDSPSGSVENALGIAHYFAMYAEPCVRADAAATALVVWAERRLSWDPSVGKLETFAWQRMRGAVLDERRRSALRQQAETAWMSVHGSAMIEPHYSTEIAVRAVLSRLGPGMDSCELVLLRTVYYGGASVAQAAKQEGRSPDALARAHSRLLARLRPELLTVAP